MTTTVTILNLGFRLNLKRALRGLRDVRFVTLSGFAAIAARVLAGRAGQPIAEKSVTEIP